MKKKVIIILIIIGTLAVGLGITAFINRDMINNFTSNKELEGDQGSIPGINKKSRIPLEKRENDWTSWRGGSRGNGRSGETGILTDWSSPLRQEWEVDYLCTGRDTATWSAPVIQGRHLIICGRDEENDLVFCLNAETGEIIWKQSYKTQKKPTHGAGARATPCIDEERVYTFGRGGDLICWDTLSGQKIWHTNVNKEGGVEPKWGHSTSPLVYKDLVIVGAGGTARIIAFNKKTGVVRWKSGEGDPGYTAISMMPIEDKEVVLTFHHKGLSAMNPDDGSELWFTPWKPNPPVNATTPVFSGNEVFITSNYGFGCELLKVSQTEATVLWRNKAIASHHSDPIIIDGYIYGYSGMSTQNRGPFKCLDQKTGEVMWSTRKIGWGTFVYVDGNLLCLDIKGNLYLIKPDPEEFIKITEMKNIFGTIKGPVWTVPVIANGLLYLRYKQQLICFRLKKAV